MDVRLKDEGMKTVLGLYYCYKIYISFPSDSSTHNGEIGKVSLDAKDQTVARADTSHAGRLFVSIF